MRQQDNRHGDCIKREDNTKHCEEAQPPAMPDPNSRLERATRVSESKSEPRRKRKNLNGLEAHGPKPNTEVTCRNVSGETRSKASNILNEKYW